jgi:hypothetical protein
MGEVLQEPSHIDHWLNAADGNPDWDQLLGDFGATVDYPACTFWRELADHYPSAKVLLSVRDATRWFESTSATILSPDFNESIKASPFGEMTKRTIWDTLDGRMDDRDFMVSYFDRRIEQIRGAIPDDRLLIYEVKHGWQPLCEFLELPVPDTSFPRINNRDETKQFITKIIEAGGDRSDETTMAEISGDLFGDK